GCNRRSALGQITMRKAAARETVAELPAECLALPSWPGLPTMLRAKQCAACLKRSDPVEKSCSIRQLINFSEARVTRPFCNSAEQLIFEPAHAAISGCHKGELMQTSASDLCAG